MSRAFSVKSLKGRVQTSAAFRRGRKFAAGNAILYVRPRRFATDSDAPLNPDHCIFIVCTVRKKEAPRAVLRNRVKRLIRESIRAWISAFTVENTDFPLLTIAVQWMRPPASPRQISLADVQPVIHELLWQALRSFGGYSIQENQESHEDSSAPDNPDL
jgi:ribonuclease P protein component